MVSQGRRARKRTCHRHRCALLQTAPCVFSEGRLYRSRGGWRSCRRACLCVRAGAGCERRAAATSGRACRGSRAGRCRARGARPAPAPVAEPAVSGCPPGEDETELPPGTPEDAPAPPPAAAAAQDGPGDGPVAHCSQNAGDNQYRDPFANSPPPKSQGGADSAQAPETDTAQPTTGSTTLLEDGTTDPAAAAAAAAAGNGLPNTGLGLGGLVALGLPLLAGGLALRRRTA